MPVSEGINPYGNKAAKTIEIEKTSEGKVKVTIVELPPFDYLTESVTEYDTVKQALLAVESELNKED